MSFFKKRNKGKLVVEKIIEIQPNDVNVFQQTAAPSSTGGNVLWIDTSS